ncbi:hypothetical protein Droror1_Dr00005679 [Drosera rotundifolia]
MPATKANTSSITAIGSSAASASAGEPKQLPCPRCESTNTKFCYYNNYNLSQPRHYCKSCRRYWTRGGTLRNIPFGGAHRKNKRPRSSSSATAPPAPPAPQESSEKADVNVNEAAENEFNFTALMGLGEYGIGPDEMIGNGLGLGLGKMDWPIGEDGGGWQLGLGGGGGDGCVGFSDGGDCFSWPEIAISSAPGKGLE